LKAEQNSPAANRSLTRTANMQKSALEHAIDRGMKPDADLGDELYRLGDFAIRSRSDARAICNALAHLPLDRQRGGIRSPLHALIGLFQRVEGPDAEAFEVLRSEGLSQLIRIFDTLYEDADESTADDLLYILKILALYGSEEGLERIVQAARKPFRPEAYMWSVIFDVLAEADPNRDSVFERLRDPLPGGFVAVALVDGANKAAIAGSLQDHPFDSPQGKRQLEAWLTDPDAEHASYAHSATAALPFISNPERDRLLALAMDHSATGVQLEAAWASAKLGSEAGLKLLARYCLDTNHSVTARHYLAELQREDIAPPEADDPDFQAKAEFAQWLAHPNELGRPPDELDIVDHRHLAWPPEFEEKPFWLIRYRARDTIGFEEDDVNCGLVGSITWCFFGYKLHQRPPEDAYAIHCYWEMEQAGLIREVELTDQNEYEGMLRQWPGQPLDAVNFLRVSELSVELRYPQRLVALASATRDSQAGWIVLDGARSVWYPAADMPEDEQASSVLRLHIGRQLLGFTRRPDRQKYLIKGQHRRDPQKVISIYENWLIEIEKATDAQGKRLVGHLAGFFPDYVEALARVSGKPKDSLVVEVFERLLQLAEHRSDDFKKEAYDELHGFGKNFETYVRALIATGRASAVPTVINLFAPYWDHNLGYGQLGNAAYLVEAFDTAEHYFAKLRGAYENWYRAEEMSLLAEIWQRRGRTRDAHDLLIECLQKLAVESATATGSDRKLFEQWFQAHRATYLRLFPEKGQAALAGYGIPEGVPDLR
jgi:hypothetical protein